jgi:His-Xaa-Ser system radical SAM maturase HxsC
MNDFKGIPFFVEYPILGKVTFRPLSFLKRKDSILVLKEMPIKSVKKGYAAIITVFPESPDNILNDTPFVADVDLGYIDALNYGDVLLIEPSGNINRLWNVKSIHNSLMISHSCNCNCLMCPQPPGSDPDRLLEFNLQILNLIKKQPVKSIGLTGGEPTTRICDLLEIIKFFRQHFPTSSISLLSNGRAFHDMAIVKSIAEIGHQNLLIGISLQADVEKLHDEIMGARGCFSQTVRGLHNLALAKQKVEIRVVIIKNNYKRLPQLAEFIYRNFPFAKHIAFMGLEVIGKAEDNYEMIWVEPKIYAPFLERAIWHLHQRYLDVSIYNLPYCLLPQILWGFARDSISDWKKTYLEPCMTCSVKEKCPGVFSTSTQQSKNLNSI